MFACFSTLFLRLREDSGADGSDATSPRSEHLLPCSTQDLEQRGSSCSGLFESLLSLL